MSDHFCTVAWSRGDADFTGRKYSRSHHWRFDGGAVVAASSSPLSVPLPYSDATAVDPEEAFAAAVASCHMLWFLDLAARRGLTVDSYVDDTVASMSDLGDGRMAITLVLLRPALVFSGARLPDAGEVEALHHDAHDRCFIANSIRAEVRVEGRWNAAA